MPGKRASLPAGRQLRSLMRQLYGKRGNAVLMRTSKRDTEKLDRLEDILALKAKMEAVGKRADKGPSHENPFLFRTSKRAAGEEAVGAEANAEDEEDELRRLASLLKI